MKKNFLLFALLAAFAVPAHAYEDGGTGDPTLGFRDNETKTVVKLDSVAGYDDAISKGSALFYEDGTGALGASFLYKVSRNYSGTYGTVLASRYHACIATKNVATGVLSGFPCVVGGYVDYALFSKSTGQAISIGDALCVSNLATSRGTLVLCPTAVTTGQFVSLENKNDANPNTGGVLKVRVSSK